MGGPVDDAAIEDAANDNAAGPGSVRERRTLAMAAAVAFWDIIVAKDAAMTMMTMRGYGLSRLRKRGGKDEEKKTAMTAGMEVERQGGGGQLCNDDDNKG
jgi:hypothetical protein